MKIFLVGGAVRDKILGNNPRDKDYVVLDGNERDFLKKFPKAKKIGKKIPVYIYKGKEFTLSPFKTIEEDLWDRDLTINALAMDESGKIYSLPSTLEDIKNKVLRPVRAKNFIKDPLRIYRVARFLAHMPEYTLHDELKEVMKRVGTDISLLKKISPERVAAELEKSLTGKRPGLFLQILWRYNALTYWFNEFKNFKNTDLNHLVEVMNKLHNCKESVFMGMCHKLSLEDFYTFYKRLKLSNRLYYSGKFAILYKEEGKNYIQISDEKKVDLLETLDKKGLFKEFFSFIFAETSKDYYPQAHKDLITIKKVHLPQKYWNKGALSGRILKELKAKELSKG